MSVVKNAAFMRGSRSPVKNAVHAATGGVVDAAGVLNINAQGMSRLCAPNRRLRIGLLSITLPGRIHREWLVLH